MILLHYIVDAKNVKDATAAATALQREVRLLAPNCRVKGFVPKPYWKIADCFESCIEVRPPKTGKSPAVQRILAQSLAKDWSWLTNKTCAVWRRSGRRQFKIPHVRWAELDLI